MMVLPFIPMLLFAVAIFIVLRVVVFRGRKFSVGGWRVCQRCGRTSEPHAGFCPRCGQRL